VSFREQRHNPDSRQTWQAVMVMTRGGPTGSRMGSESQGNANYSPACSTGDDATTCRGDASVIVVIDRGGNTSYPRRDPTSGEGALLGFELLGNYW